MLFRKWVAAAITIAASRGLASPAGSFAFGLRDKHDDTFGPVANGESSATQAANTWIDKKTCDKSGFFETTRENLRNVPLSTFYNDTIVHLIDKDPEKYKKLGEISFFALETAGIQNFNCTSQTNMCEHMPDCSLVAHNVAEDNESLTAEGVVDLSRKVLFALEQVNDINKYFHTLDVSKNISIILHN